MLICEGDIRLRDGRFLGYSEYGAPEGRPILYFHGLPASRLEAALTDRAALRLGIRIVAPDRPGFGRTDFQPGRTLTAWPEDVGQLVDALGLQRFAVLGVSGGGPCAVACACLMPQRLTAVGLIGSLGPVARPELARALKWPARLSFFLARRWPEIARWLYAEPAGRLLRLRPMLALHLLQVAAPDKPVLKRIDIRNILQDSIREAFRCGGRGALEELRLYASEWGLDLARIDCPVHLWHGEQDRTVPVIMGRHLAATIPDCRARFYWEEGHFSLPVNHMEEILATLVGGKRWPRGSQPRPSC
jgi:pimeloyl-ACP methyl ester carboxylesterase